MKRDLGTIILLAGLVLALAAADAHAQSGYRIDKITEQLYAAVARPGMRASSNAFFVVGRDYVVAGGAHMSKEAIGDLFEAIAEISAKPVRYFILSHHHQGFSHIDFDFPAEVELIMAAPTWQALNREVRKSANAKLFFSEGISLDLGNVTLVLSNLEAAHSNGDLLVYIPEAETVYTGDLLYVRSVGYMGDGHLRNWLQALDFVAALGARTIIPGYGGVCSTKELDEFRAYFRDFTSTVLEHLERGETLAQTLKTFKLERYSHFDGFDRLLRPNIERAYQDLKQDLARE